MNDVIPIIKEMKRASDFADVMDQLVCNKTMTIFKMFYAFAISPHGGFFIGRKARMFWLYELESNIDTRLKRDLVFSNYEFKFFLEYVYQFLIV